MKKILHSIWEWWKPIAFKIADVQTAILLFLVYWLVAGPMALVMRVFGGAREFKRRTAPSHWQQRQHSPLSDEERLRFQF